ncbi:MAG: phenylalanine--tRNA ligase subunit alpha [Flavobacteriales bacterium]|nr:phenylalanine--tRNA ligase subunit alpha [Flavobacteriales bacterium]
MLSRVQELLEEVQAFSGGTKEELESFRMRFLGKKGVMNDLFAAFKDVAPDQRKEFGQRLNELKNAAQAKVDELKTALESERLSGASGLDLTRSPEPIALGARHPVSLVKNRIIGIFSRIGFTLSEGPEIEDDRHNFSALNFTEEHPARDMQDTFFVMRNPDYLLRTHTSSVQVRHMEKNQPPIRILSPGRVFRNEAISARSHCIFHQIEGLYIDRDVSFADLRQTLLYFAKEFFGEETKIRLRPSYFPFTEPSAEMDIWWGLENEVDYRMTKGTGWLEIMGCGMVDPNVLKNVGIDPEVYTGFAFGIGIERIALQQFQIPDIRLLFENDVRFLEQFTEGIY